MGKRQQILTSLLNGTSGTLPLSWMKTYTSIDIEARPFNRRSMPSCLHSPIRNTCSFARPMNPTVCPLEVMGVNGPIEVVKGSLELQEQKAISEGRAHRAGNSVLSMTS